MSPEVHAKIAVTRQKMLDGTATVEELREAVSLMREDRKAAPISTPGGAGARRAKAKAEIKSADEMLDELGKI